MTVLNAITLYWVEHELAENNLIRPFKNYPGINNNFTGCLWRNQQLLESKNGVECKSDSQRTLANDTVFVSESVAAGNGNGGRKKEAVLGCP